MRASYGRSGSEPVRNPTGTSNSRGLVGLFASLFRTKAGPPVTKIVGPFSAFHPTIFGAAVFLSPEPATPVPPTIPVAVQARTVTPMGSLFARIMNSRTRCAPPTAATGAMCSSIYRVSLAVRKV